MRPAVSSIFFSCSTRCVPTICVLTVCECMYIKKTERPSDDGVEQRGPEIDDERWQHLFQYYGTIGLPLHREEGKNAHEWRGNRPQNQLFPDVYNNTMELKYHCFSRLLNPSSHLINVIRADQVYQGSYYSWGCKTQTQWCNQWLNGLSKSWKHFLFFFKWHQHIFFLNCYLSTIPVIKCNQLLCMFTEWYHPHAV